MFSGSIGLAGWFGNVPSSSKYSGTTSQPRRANTEGTVRPAMPLPASIAILNGAIFAGSTNERQCSANASSTSRREMVPRRAASGPRSPAAMRSRIARRPVSNEMARACSRVNFMPLYRAGLCDAVIITPPA